MKRQVKSVFFHLITPIFAILEMHTNARHCLVFLDQICSIIISGIHGIEFLSLIWEHCGVWRGGGGT